MTLHDQYENWRRADANGNFLPPNSPAETGSVVQLGTANSGVPAGEVSVNIPPHGINWNVAGINGGAVLTGIGSIASVAGKTPTWVGLLIGLAGLTMQTVASQPTDTKSENSPAQMNLSLMQAAYQQTDPSNVLDANFRKLTGNNSDLNGFLKGKYGAVTVTVTLSAQTYNYYFRGDEYDNAGLLNTNASGSVLGVPGSYLWSYEWHCAGTPIGPGPGPIDPNPSPNAVSPMPSP